MKNWENCHKATYIFDVYGKRGFQHCFDMVVCWYANTDKDEREIKGFLLLLWI